MEGQRTNGRLGRQGLNVIDLFAGSGGMSLGFEMAGFGVPIACEIDGPAADTYEANHHATKMIRADVRRVESWARIADELGVSIDGVIGGCPCQGFALCGRRDPKDPRNSLFVEFVRCVRELRPTFLVMENVPGLLSMSTSAGHSVAAAIWQSFQDAGYRVQARIVDAADCGVPQARRRVFFIGFRKDLEANPDWHELLQRPSPVTVDMAISDLPLGDDGDGMAAAPWRG